MIRAIQLLEDDELLQPSADFDDQALKNALLADTRHLGRIEDPSENSQWIRLLSSIQRNQKRGHATVRLADNTYARIAGKANLTDPILAVRLYDTDIAMLYPDGRTVYSNGGWATRITADRIAGWMKGGWRVFTHKGQWYWYNYHTHIGDHRDTIRIPFTDGDSIDAYGFLTAQAAPVPVRRRRRVAEGIYADLSHGRPEFYVSCPKCGVVHGGFKTQREAQYHQVCGTCEFEARQDLLKRLEKEGRPKR